MTICLAYIYPIPHVFLFVNIILEHPEVALRATALANIRDRRIAAAKLQRDTLHKNLESIYDFEKVAAETQHRQKMEEYRTKLEFRLKGYINQLEEEKKILSTSTDEGKETGGLNMLKKSKETGSEKQTIEITSTQDVNSISHKNQEEGNKNEMNVVESSLNDAIKSQSQEQQQKLLKESLEQNQVVKETTLIKELPTQDIQSDLYSIIDDLKKRYDKHVEHEDKKAQEAEPVEVDLEEQMMVVGVSNQVYAINDQIVIFSPLSNQSFFGWILCFKEKQFFVKLSNGAKIRIFYDYIRTGRLWVKNSEIDGYEATLVYNPVQTQQLQAEKKTGEVSKGKGTKNDKKGQKKSSEGDVTGTMNAYTMNNQEFNPMNTMMNGGHVFDPSFVDPNMYGISNQGMMQTANFLAMQNMNMLTPEQQIYQEQMQIEMQMRMQMQMQMQMQMEEHYLMQQQQQQQQEHGHQFSQPQQQQAFIQQGLHDTQYIGEQIDVNHPMFPQYQQQQNEQSHLQQAQLNSHQNM